MSKNNDGPWLIEGNAIPCGAGKNTRICFLPNGTPELILATDGLPADLERVVRSWRWARSAFSKNQPVRSVIFPREYLATVARVMKAATV